MTSRMWTHPLSRPLASARRPVTLSDLTETIPSRNRKGVFHSPQRVARADEGALPVWGQGVGPVQMDLRSTSNHEKPSDPPAVSSWGRPWGLSRWTGGPRATTKNLVGQAHRPAAEPQLGAELYVRAGSAGDLVAGDQVINRDFDRTINCRESRRSFRA